MTDVGRPLRGALAAAFELPVLRPPTRSRSPPTAPASCSFGLEQGSAVEAVIIPDPPRLTVCISSQAGCAMGCRLLRHRAARPAAQPERRRDRRPVGWRRGAPLDDGERITNVVFMGMGEPLHNYDAVVEAIEILTAPWGFGLSGRRVTVSTVGLVPQLERLVRETSASIAVSLTATTDALRNRLMPVNRRYPLAELVATCRALPIAAAPPHHLRVRPARRRQRRRSPTPPASSSCCTASAPRSTSSPSIPSPAPSFAPPAAGASIREFQQRLLAAGVNASVRATPRPRHPGRLRPAGGDPSGAVPAAEPRPRPLTRDAGRRRRSRGVAMVESAATGGETGIGVDRSTRASERLGAPAIGPSGSAMCSGERLGARDPLARRAGGRRRLPRPRGRRARRLRRRRHAGAHADRAGARLWRRMRCRASCRCAPGR